MQRRIRFIVWPVEDHYTYAAIEAGHLTLQAAIEAAAAYTPDQISPSIEEYVIDETRAICVAEWQISGNERKRYAVTDVGSIAQATGYPGKGALTHHL